MAETLRNIHGWRWLTASAIVNEGETVLYKLSFLGSSNGCRVSLYEGLDATSGRKIGTFRGLENSPNTVDFGGIFLDRGLFVVLESHVDGVLVIYDTLKDEREDLVE